MAELWLCTCLSVFVFYLTVLYAQNLDCDFEGLNGTNNFCDWTTPDISDLRWARSKRKSNSPGTGPTTGHTSVEDNYYIYLVVTPFESGKNCILLSPDFNTSDTGRCFRFWYHMQGAGIGNLTLDVIDGNVPPSQKWTKSGTQGPNWTCGSFSLDENKANLKIQITAFTGPNPQGEIALDDLKLFNQRCQTIKETDYCTVTSTTTPVSSTSTTSINTTTGPPPPVTSTKMGANTTVGSPETTTNPGDLTEMILYIALVPVGILILGGVIACICYRSRKQKDQQILQDIEINRRYSHLNDIPTNNAVPEEDREEVYHELDEGNMDDNHDGDYTMPVNTPDNNNMKPYGTYLTMRNSVLDEDAVSVNSNYVEPMASPNDSSGFHGNKNMAYVKDEDDGRNSPAPDYDAGDAKPPPPKCGNTKGYIRAVYD